MTGNTQSSVSPLKSRKDYASGSLETELTIEHLDHPGLVTNVAADCMSIALLRTIEDKVILPLVKFTDKDNPDGSVSQTQQTFDITVGGARVALVTKITIKAPNLGSLVTSKLAGLACSVSDFALILDEDVKALAEKANNSESALDREILRFAVGALSQHLKDRRFGEDNLGFNTPDARYSPRDLSFPFGDPDLSGGLFDDTMNGGDPLGRLGGVLYGPDGPHDYTEADFRRKDAQRL